LLVLLPCAILASGWAAFEKLKSLRERPPRREQVDHVPEVRVLEIRPQRKQLLVTGYGTSRFVREIPIVPEVSGKVTKTSPRLRVGAFIPKGELLLEIDQTNYRNAQRRAQAEVSRAQASLDLLKQREANANRQIEVMRENVQLAQQDMRRVEDLAKTGASTQQEQESSRRAYLLQQTTLVKFQNDLALVPPQIKETEAVLETAKARLGDADADVARTRILCPFPARIMSASVEAGQVLAKGQTVARIADITAAEIPVVVEPAQLGYLPFTKREMESEGSKALDFPARVRWVGFDKQIAWDARVTRIEPVDHRTRTVPVVVQVDNPWREFEPDKRPPFLAGMYCRVEIEGRVVEDALTVPRSALREGGVAYVVREGRLTIVPLTIRFRMESELIVSNGLLPGDQVVLSPLAFPVNGMKLSVRTDDEARASAQEAAE